ncbi:MAG: hypothetical protein ABEJ58_00770 [Halodesulfurarchaeum sp.]
MGLFDVIADIFKEPERQADTDYYVLERAEPEADPRVEEFDEKVTPEDVMAMDEFSKGTIMDGKYILQEILTTGTAGEVIWEEELEFD